MASPACVLLAFLLCLVSSSVVAQATPGVGRIRTHTNGSVLITSPVNGSVLLNGNNPLDEIAALKIENAVLRESLKGVRSVVAGLGIKQWTRQFGTNGTDSHSFGNGASTDSADNVYVVGQTTGAMDGNNKGLADMFVAKLDRSGVIQWMRQIGSNATETGRGCATDSGDNVYAAGHTEGGVDGNQNVGLADIFLVKFDSSGIKQWTRQVGSTNTDIANAVATDSADNVYVTGYTKGGLDGNVNVGSLDMFLTKYDSSGVRQWTRQLGSSGDEVGLGVATDSAGYVYVTGRTTGGLDGNSHAGQDDMFVAKYNSLGVKQWTRQLGTTELDYGLGAATDSDNSVYVAGYTKGGIDGHSNAGSAGTEDMFVTKYDSAGLKQWTQQHGTSANDIGKGVATDRNNNVFVAGYTQGGFDGYVIAGSFDVFWTKYNSFGVEQWTRQLGSSGDDYATSVATDSEGSVFVTGSTSDVLDGNTNAGSADMIVIKFGLP